MAIVKIVCTSCGGKIDFDDSRDKGFCMFCGTAFLREQVIAPPVAVSPTTTVVIEGGTSDANLAVRANAMLADKNYRGAIDTANRALEINPNNTEAQSVLNSIYLVAGDLIGQQDVDAIDRLIVERAVLLKNYPFGKFKFILGKEKRESHKAFKTKLKENNTALFRAISNFDIGVLKAIINVVATKGWSELLAHKSMHLLSTQIVIT